jgi:hypothetical protein
MIAPHKTNPVLFVDTDAVLLLPVPSQFLQAIPRRLLKVKQFRGGV